ncbi:restriction endonuclease subunit S [Candidatus Gracilibacteria bacterium]|nr:restriction endonuclease subunit S [Candidatus Gracilibacteria bacterium]
MSTAKNVKMLDSIKFKYFPLTFIKSREEKKRQILNTVIFKYIEDRYNDNRELSDLIESTQYGYNASALKKGGNKFLRISDIKEGEVDWQNVPFCNCSDDKTYMLNIDDILIARTGGTTGKSFLIQSAPSGAIYAGYLIRLRCKKNVNPRYIYAFLNSYAYWPQISELKGGSAQPNVNAEKLKKIIIPNCPLEVQDKIVSFIESNEIDDENLKIKIKKIDRSFEYFDRNKALFSTQEISINNLRQQILHDAISGKLTENWRRENTDVTPASEILKRTKEEKLTKEKKNKKGKPLPSITEGETLFKLPTGWAWTRLGELGLITRGKSPKYNAASSVGGLNQKCIRWGYIDTSFCKKVEERWFNNLDSETLTKDGDILVNSTGEGTIGRSALVEDSAIGLIYDSHVLCFRGLDIVESQYIMFLINGKFGQKQIEDSKGAKTTKQTELGVENLKNLYIPLPPFFEQKAIVAKVESLTRKCDQIEAKMNQTEQNAELLLQAFLAEAFKA